MLNSKRIIVIGDCNGVATDTIVECLESINAQIVFRTTQCFI